MLFQCDISINYLVPEVVYAEIKKNNYINAKGLDVRVYFYWYTDLNRIPIL